MESLMRKNLEMAAPEGLVQVQDDQKNMQSRSQPALTSCKLNRWLPHANGSRANARVGQVPADKAKWEPER